MLVEQKEASVTGMAGARDGGMRCDQVRWGSVGLGRIWGFV